MPDAIITSTASTFGTITGTFAADQSTITGTVTGIITGTLDGSVGVPGVGVPDGGTTGQVLQKASATAYDTVWATPTGGAWGTITGTLSNQTDLQTALNLKAPLASPAFTGNPTAPTAATLTSTTQLATTAFVQQELLSGTANAKNLEVYVRNQTGSTLVAGTIVYINGATGNRPTVTPAQANNDANSAQTFGFVKTSIANNGFGFVIVRGELENVDTSALTEGVQLYLSPTTAGTWTTTKPSAPQHLVYVGICVRAHPTQGVILVAVQNGYELNELHDVQITSPTNGQVLKYNSSTSLWYNGLDVGVPSGGTAGQFLTKIDGTDYNTDWTTVNLSVYAVKSNNLSDLTSASTARTNLGLGTMATATASDYSTTTVANGLYYPLSTNPAGYLTASSLTPYLTKADNLGSLTNFATARDNLGLGTLSSPTFAGVTVQGAGANVANLTPTSLSLTHATSGSFTIQPSVGITFPDASVQTTAFTGIPAGYITSVSSPLSVSSGNLSVDLSAYLTSATAASTYQTLSGMSSYLTTSAAASTYLTQSNAASTYQTLSGMSSYLTTSTAASTYATILEPSVDGILTVEPSGINSAEVRIRQDANNYMTLYPGGSQLSIVYGGALKWFFNDTYLQFPGGTQQTVAYPGPSGFLLKADNLSGLANTATARTNLGLGTMAVETASNYLTTATAASTYQTLSGMSSYLTTSTAASTYQTISGMSSYLTTASAASTYFTIASAANKADLASPTFTGVPAAPTASPGTNTTQLATTAFVTAAVSASTGATWGSITGTLSSQTDLQSALDAKLSTATAASTYAPLDSPALTGNPTAPTPLTADNDTSIATTAFVKAQGYITSAPVTSVAGKTGAVTLVNTDISGFGTMSTATAADYSTTTVANGLYYPLASNPAGYLTTAPVTSVAGKTGAVTLVAADVSGVVSTSAANTYTAGAKQTVSHSATTAGLNVGPVAGNPSSLANGDVWLNSTTNAINARVNGGTHQLNTVKAWVNFNGTGTVAIRASMNVSSITDNGVGDYTVNFTTAMADANYAAAGGVESIIGVSYAIMVFDFARSTDTRVAPTASALRVSVCDPGSANGRDPQYAYVTVIR